MHLKWLLIDDASNMIEVHCALFRIDRGFCPPSQAGLEDLFFGHLYIETVPVRLK